jgi:hypothetical protein
MMIHQHELKAEDVHAFAVEIMKKNLQIEANGYLCKTGMLYDVLLKASAECSSLEAVCADLEDVADSNTQRAYLNLALSIKELSSQEAQANQALADCIPDSMVRTGVEVAVDFHDEPFYGKQEDLRAVTCGGQAKKGTTHFVRIATAYVASGAADSGCALRLARRKNAGRAQNPAGTAQNTRFSSKSTLFGQGLCRFTDCRLPAFDPSTSHHRQSHPWKDGWHTSPLSRTFQLHN